MNEERRRDGNEELRAQGFEIIPEEELAEGTTRVTFFGEARYVPEVGDRVEVRAEDGTWRGGFRATSGVSGDERRPEEDVVGICAEDEWASAEREDRAPAGGPYPLERVREAGA